MDKPIAIRIDVTKITKSRLFKGEKGTYLNAVLLPVSNSQYGDDFMIVEDQTKEERQSGTKGAIIGNAKYRGKGDHGGQQTQSKGGNQKLPWE